MESEWKLKLTPLARTDLEEIYQYINEAGLNTTQDSIHFLPFWENGVRFFTIKGPNKEKIEFSQYL